LTKSRWLLLKSLRTWRIICRISLQIYCSTITEASEATCSRVIFNNSFVMSQPIGQVDIWIDEQQKPCARK
jgi:hypothetical protein